MHCSGVPIRNSAGVGGDGMRVVTATGSLMDEMIGKHHEVKAEFFGESRRLAHRVEINRGQKKSEFHSVLIDEFMNRRA